MAVIEGGVSAGLVGVAAQSASGLHSIAKPQDYGSLGSYKYAGATGAVAAGMAANGEIFQFRWSDATRFAVITKIKVTGLRATTAFAAGAIDLKATIARTFTANGSGGTPLTLTDPQLQLRTSMGVTLVGDARIATTAALGAGTKTLDTQDVGFIAGHSSGGDGSATPIIGSIKVPNNGELFVADIASGEHPIVLAQNEGIVIRATVPATGVWNASVEITWAEVTAF